MQLKLKFEPHLVLKKISLSAGEEWAPRLPGWVFLHLSSGAGYWLNPGQNHDLVNGSVLVLSERCQGVFRATQLGPVMVHYFCLQPERLTGLMTLVEQQQLQHALAEDRLAVRLLEPSAPSSKRFRAACESAGRGNHLQLRLELLALSFQAFEGELSKPLPPQMEAIDAKSRLIRLLDEVSLSDLLDMSFAELVREIRCTNRHMSRIFHEVVGMSFREKQAQVRLRRAQELLATTESKVVDVALESGYESLSLFNLMFKRRFGTTPARWRDQSRKTNSRRKPTNAPAILLG